MTRSSVNLGIVSGVTGVSIRGMTPRSRGRDTLHGCAGIGILSSWSHSHPCGKWKDDLILLSHQ